MAYMPGSIDARGSTRRPERRSTSIARYYQTIRSHLLLIAACTIVTLGAAVAYVKLASKSYTATASMVVNPAAASNTVLFSLPVLHTSGDPTTDVLTAASVIHTQQIAQATVTALHLKMSAATLLGNVSVVPEDQSNVLAITAKSSGPTRARRIANTYAQEAVAVRTANLHQAIESQLPSIRASAAGVPSATANAAGGIGQILSQYEQLLSGPDPTISVSAQATQPLAASSPKTKLSIAIGLVIGLLIGIGAAFALDALDPRLKREEQLAEAFPNVPVLARVPKRKGRSRPGPLKPAELPAVALEEYRTLRATIAARSSREPQALLITGTGPSEGKSTSAINLAAVLAHGGDSVILIDADLRRPSIAASFGLHEFYGTEDVLRGETSLLDALQTVTVGSATINVLAAHGNSLKDVDRLSPAAARRLVEAAKVHADMVVIDSPPLTAVIDALPFAQVVDSVLFAVRMDHTRLAKLSQAAALLENQDAEPTGVILIGVQRGDDYGYGYDLAGNSAKRRNGSSDPEVTSLRLGRGETRPQ
jgi:polysaccharide biosynthesis transport protein